MIFFGTHAARWLLLFVGAVALLGKQASKVEDELDPEEFLRFSQVTRGGSGS
jgi:hypothetical protein